MSGIAIVRPPSKAYANCIRPEAVEIDVALAVQQHQAYCKALRACGLKVKVIDPEPEMPDACFVEDAAVVVGDRAVITRPGAEARHPELDSVEKAIDLECVRMEKGRLDGGDVIVLPDRILVGLSDRTDKTGAKELQRRAGRDVKTIPVKGFLHLKTRATPAGNRRLIVGENSFPRGAFEDLDVFEVDEPMGACVLAVGSQIVVSEQAPWTVVKLQELEFETHTVDIGEFHKGDAGVTCLSLITRT